MFLVFFFNLKREIFTIPYLNFPIVWYSILLAFGFFVGYYIFLHLLKRYLSFSLKGEENNLRKISMYITDKVLSTTILATIIGARLGHLLFYEDPNN